MAWLLILIICATLIFWAYMSLKNKYKYFEKWGITHEEPELLFGNMRKVSFNQEHMNDILLRLHHKRRDDLYFGLYNFLKPIIVIKDLELLKKIMVKDFDHFIDHMQFTDETVDPLNGKMLFALNGEKWKEMRTTLSPAFTSSKMRGMMPLMETQAQNFVEYIREKLKEKASKDIGCAELEAKDIFSRYANDVIASCGFGIEVNSFKDINNTFYRMGKLLTTFNFLESMKVFIYFLSPALARFLKIEFAPKEASSFMRTLVKNNIAQREQGKIVRHDMIHLLMLAKQGKLHAEKEDDGSQSSLGANQKVKTEWTDDDITAQVVLFLFAGFDTSSNLMSFLSYELAINPDIQKKLQEEIDDVVVKTGGKLNYNDLHGMKYLDMVMQEILRLWPGFPNTDRLCVKDYELPPPNGSSTQKYTIKKGDAVFIPAFSIHRDPTLFDQPEKFIPERFADENKSKILPLSSMAFGAGPRACIGSRFALMEIKLIFFYILKEFDFVRIPKTPVPMVLMNHLFSFIPINGMWIGIRPRQDTS